ncbi:MAG: UDP-N-acetylmuramoyl-L-alanine--D-glutamate ligase, partial [Acidimicrobiales bacterium]
MSAAQRLPGRVLVVGMGRSGEAVARACLARGCEVLAVDDAPGDAPVRRARAAGAELVARPDRSRLADLARWADLVVVSPGVPAAHPVFGLGGGVEVCSEVEIGASIAAAPLVAVTGTNGKTTVVTLVTRMLVASGMRAVAAGNIGLPLVEAAGRGAEVLVVEVSSFQLAHTRGFRPAVAAWLNVAPDHLDWHPSWSDYVASKARIWAKQASGDVAIGNSEDPVVAEQLALAPGRRVSFGLGRGDWCLAGGVLRAPDGAGLLARSELWRQLPSDVLNALAALAAAEASGAERGRSAEVLRRFEGLAHRVELVREVAGVRYYDDSKATTPDAVLAALAGFDSVVLVAGGRSKGLDLGPLAAAAERLRAVVAIGESAGELEEVFAGSGVPTARAGSMDQAVGLAAGTAQAG